MRVTGLYTAMITPFKEDGSVDYEGFERNIEFQIKNGVDGLLPLGTTGEASSLTDKEKNEIIKLAAKTINRRVPLMIGTGTNNTQHTIENTKIAKELGADCALIIPPYYSKPSQEGIFRHFEAITKAVDIPIMVYNIQGRTGVNIETSTLKRIVNELPNIVSVKEASGNIAQITDVINEISNNNFSVLSGDDSLTLPLMALGGEGVVSVVSNLIPKQISQMVNAIKNNDYKTARDIHFKYLPLFKVAFIESNPVPIKKAMSLKQMSSGGVRLPLYKLQNKSEEAIQAVLKNLNLI